MSFGKKVVTPVTPAPVPTVATPAVEAAAESERRRQRTASGRAATMLSKQEDYTAPNIGTTKLLGG
jgi:hypothetical protein